MSGVTHILKAIDRGDAQASARLLPLVYEELRKLAAQRMAVERSGHTLQATALVHEAFLRLVSGDGRESWSSRGHFFAAAAEAMRRILIESARRRRSLKAGGDRHRLDLTEVDVPAPGQAIDLIALDEALRKLEQQEPRKAEVVKLRFFGGLTMDETAGALGISRATAENDWAYARAWLRLEMGEPDPVDKGPVRP